MAKQGKGDNVGHHEVKSPDDHGSPADRQKPARDSKGRLLPGHTANPGGMPKEVAEYRRQALSSVPRALERAVELMEMEDPVAINFGVTHILNRGLGKEGKLADLPIDLPELPEPTDTSPAAMLSLAMKGLVRVLQFFENKAKVGHHLGVDESKMLLDASHALASLAKEDREIGKAGPGAALGDNELRAAVVASIPDEMLEAELAKRKEAK